MEAAAGRRDVDHKARLIFILMFLFISLLIFGFVKLLNMGNAISLSSCDPRKYVQELQVPRLLNHTLKSSIIVGIEFKRGAATPGDVAIYRDLNLRLYYDLGEDPVANHTVPRFRMGDRRSVRYSVAVDASRLPWEDAFDKISGGSTVLLRVVLSGKFIAQEHRDEPGFYRGKCDICDCDWSEFEAEADVWVDASAHMISNSSLLFYEI